MYGVLINIYDGFEILLTYFKSDDNSFRICSKTVPILVHFIYPKRSDPFIGSRAYY